MAMAAAVIVVPMLVDMLTKLVPMVNSTIASFRSLGLSDAEIMAHIAGSEMKLDPLVLRLSAFEIQRHPDDK